MKKLNMKLNQFPGALITFCGLDGCGKSTMLRMTHEWLLDHELCVCVTKQPTDFVRQSDIFRTYMDSPDHSAYDYRSLSLLAASDRVQHGSKVIEAAMAQGMVVLSDRYYYSCLANLRARGYRKDRWIYEASRWVIKPDLAFFFDVPVETAMRRVRTRPEEVDRYIDVDLQYQLRQEYVEICKRNNGILIYTDQEPEESFIYVKKELERKFLK